MDVRSWCCLSRQLIWIPIFKSPAIRCMVKGVLVSNLFFDFGTHLKVVVTCTLVLFLAMTIWCTYQYQLVNRINRIVRWPDSACSTWNINSFRDLTDSPSACRL